MRSVDKLSEQFSSLQTELAEAEVNNDLGQKETIQRKLDRLTEEFLEASGSSGRSKKEIDDVERLRKSISNAISRAIKAIEKEHAELGRHLSNAIKRGQFLSYAPEQSITWVTE